MDVLALDITNTTSASRETCIGHACLTQDLVAAFLSCNVVISLVGIAGNSLVLLSVVRTRSLQNQNNVFLASLAVADLIMMAIGVPAHTVIGFGFLHHVDPWLCLSLGTFINGLAFVTIFHIAVVAFDRYLAVTSPMTYNQKMTNTRVAALIVGIWLTATVIASISFAWNNIGNHRNDDTCDVFFVLGRWYRVMAVILVIVFPFSATTYWYFVIFRIALGHRRRIRAIDIALGANGIARAENFDTVSRIKADIRAAITLIIVISFFVIAWTPGITLIIIDILVPLPKLRSTYIHVIVLIATTNAFLNSAVNPIIYAARNREFRKAFRAQLGKMLRCFTK